MGIVVNKESYDRWRKFVMRYGGKVPCYHHKGSMEFLFAVCDAIPFDLSVVPIERVKQKKSPEV